MKKTRTIALALVLTLLVGAAPVSAAEAEAWLVPQARDYAGQFTDVTGSWCEDAVQTVYEAGLMEGADARHFMPSVGLSHAQIVVIAARLHKLLSGGSLDDLTAPAPGGAAWWTPYDSELRSELPALGAEQFYQDLLASPTAACTRLSFLRLLSAVLRDTGAALSAVNDVAAVPDCCEADLLAFYRWGVLGGKDQYGTLEGGASLSRGAAAAMLARLIDPAQRLVLDLVPLELCQALLGIGPETVLMTVAGQEITAGQFMPTLAETLSYYNHAHFAAMGLEQSGRGAEDLAAEEVCRLILCETLAEELGLDVPAAGPPCPTGYRGLTAEGQAWDNHHRLLERAVAEALGETPFPQDRLPTADCLPVWETLDFFDASIQLQSLPVWGGTW